MVLVNKAITFFSNLQKGPYRRLQFVRIPHADIHRRSKFGPEQAKEPVSILIGPFKPSVILARNCFVLNKTFNQG